MEPLDAVVVVLREAGVPLHWTVIQDRALRQGLIDPFAVADVRAMLLRVLRDGVLAGALVRAGTGVYTLAGPTDRGQIDGETETDG